ncbi:hypothetical protein JHFBIEKO_3546 [Methylobacterium mesophilicum]|uniref:hypothetical protein n=1 Tax=Methylobacterium mesophilicum TaxID=39956 RepID=UPI001EE1C7BD|nr:hypothetical protein [Methylobacterium mesophilicum]GJE23085.1 hypothetical protein JHFBIEKO_3546 [Methylobacterium mesophilicum]
MTRKNTTTELLIRLIQRVPMLAIDVKAAEAEGDLPAIAYQGAVTAWQREAAAAVAEIREGYPPRDRRVAPDAYARAAAAADMMWTTLEPASA